MRILKFSGTIVFKSVYDDDFRLLDIPESASRRPRADLGLSQLQSLKWNPKPKKSFKSEFSDLVTSLFQKLIFILLWHFQDCLLLHQSCHPNSKDHSM